MKTFIEKVQECCTQQRPNSKLWFTNVDCAIEWHGHDIWCMVMHTNGTVSLYNNVDDKITTLLDTSEIEFYRITKEEIK